jgi:RND family efflux transporter MFP subunit
MIVLNLRRRLRPFVAILLISSFSRFLGAEEFDCMIHAQQEIAVRSPLEARIESIAAQRGQRINPGDVLVTLETGPERAALTRAKAKVDMIGAIKAAEARVQLARKKVARNEELQKQKYIAATALEEARTELQLAEAELVEARDNQRMASHDVSYNEEILKQRVIRSPIRGVVVDRYQNPGELAGGDGKHPIMKLAEIDPLRVEVVLPVSMFGKVQENGHAEVRPETTDKSFAANVKIVDSVVDASSGTFGVRLQLANPKLSIPAGVKCKVTFAFGISNTKPGNKAKVR